MVKCPVCDRCWTFQKTERIAGAVDNHLRFMPQCEHCRVVDLGVWEEPAPVPSWLRHIPVLTNNKVQKHLHRDHPDVPEEEWPWCLQSSSKHRTDRGGRLTEGPRGEVSL